MHPHDPAKASPAKAAQHAAVDRVHVGLAPRLHAGVLGARVRLVLDEAPGVDQVQPARARLPQECRGEPALPHAHLGTDRALREHPNDEALTAPEPAPATVPAETTPSIALAGHRGTLSGGLGPAAAPPGPPLRAPLHGGGKCASIHGMDLGAAREFMREHHRAVLATRRGSAGIQQSPVLVNVDAGGRAIISSRETAFKTRNLRRDPRAQLCVFTDRFFGDWLYVEGRAEVVSLPDAMELLVDYSSRFPNPADDWDAYRDRMERERRVLLRIELERAGPERRG
jgi:PPOX class probable F420-dependent enzyme